MMARVSAVIASMLAASVALAQPVDVRPIEGSWAVTGISVNGRAVDDPDLMGSAWTLRGNQLVVRSGGVTRWQFTFTPVAGTGHTALELTPESTTSPAPSWLIVAPDGPGLKIAFHRNFAGRPADFAASANLVVLSLARSAPVPSRAAEQLQAIAKPCIALYSAGIDAFLDGDVKLQSVEAPIPAPACVLKGKRGQVALVLYAEAGADAEFNKTWQARGHYPGATFQRETTFGFPTFSIVDSARGQTQYFALIGGKMMMLQFWRVQRAPAEYRQFAKRVVDAL
jgi:uncharacterized protein (TIGR03067 family)